MLDNSNIIKLVEEKLEGSDLFLSEVLIKPGNRVFVFLDGDRDVTIDDCKEISRHLNALLSEEEDLELMVSSCGADQPLKIPRQYNKHLGRSLKFQLTDGKTISGILDTLKDDGVFIRPVKAKKKKKGQEELPDTLFLPFEKIETAKVNISFNKQ
jgi:ribosome maturation factor RimP